MHHKIPKDKKDINRRKRKFDEIFFVLIVALIIIVVSMYTRESSVDDTDAYKITEFIIDRQDEMSFATGGVVDENKLNNIRNMDYDELKDQLNVKGEFCVYIEDEQGNLLLSKGSEKLSKDGLYCKE